MEVIGGAGFAPRPEKTTALGSYDIKPGKYDSAKHVDVWCGMGKYDFVGDIVPGIIWSVWLLKIVSCLVYQEVLGIHW
ncbi:hypothetical protein AA313_de0206814 [Arthrobotrys entomopaga]|nr:hypothetical protein AA313_de0206814 [Arthrobotrys entomopaga]